MSKKLTNKQIEFFKNLFLKQKEDIENICKKNCETSEIDLEGDEVDVIQASILHNVDSKILEREAKKLVKINIALTKIDNGSFGNCEDCDEFITIKRLEACPDTQFCIFCAQKAELEAKMFSGKKI